MSHELDAPPWLRVEATLMATANQIRDVYDTRLAPLGLTLSVASLLAYVEQYGPVNQTRAAEHLGQGRASTGSQIDRLEQLGMLRRVADTNDRRAWLLEITPSGRDCAEEINRIDQVVRNELRCGISRGDRQQLTQLLLRLQENLVAAQGCSSDPQESPTHQIKGAP